jgi:hypothetical protein
MNKFIAVNDACEMCVSEYISEQTKKLSELPNDQKKTDKIHRILHGANRACSKPVVRIPCREIYENNAFHNICEKHLYELIDTIKEYEDNSNDK